MSSSSTKRNTNPPPAPEFTVEFSVAQQVPKIKYDYIRTLRENKKISLVELSYETGIDRAGLWNIENGKNDNPSFTTVTELANYYSKRLENFYEFVKEKKSVDSLFVGDEAQLIDFYKRNFFSIFKNKIEIKIVK